MDDKFFEEHLRGFSIASVKYIKSSLLVDNKYINKFKLQHSQPIEVKELLLGEATGTEMCLFVIRWSLHLRVLGTQRNIDWHYLGADMHEISEDPLFQERNIRLAELKKDYSLIGNRISCSIRQRFDDKIESLPKLQLYFRRNFGIRDSNKVVVYDQYTESPGD